jgi:hypothetical protein
MMQALKSAAKQLPGLRRLVAQRDQLHRDLVMAQDERQALIRALDRLAAAPPPASPVAQAVAAANPTVDDATLARLHELQAELDRLRQSCGFVPPGHFYSPIPDLDEIRRDEARIFDQPLPRTIPGIDLREDAQLALLHELAAHYVDQPFGEQPTPGLRYHLHNESYAYSDGLMLHCMLRQLKPRRLVEIGSGFSSCVTLDTNELFLGGQMQLTFIEPYPELLQSLIRDEDRARTTILPQRLQDVDLAVFRQLQAGDVLFIDSTHVSRIDSDVNRLFFEILPALPAGVVIHFHDVFYPFEYPKHWIYFGRAWNELYLLRGFLQYNRAFEILLMNTFMAHFHPGFFRAHMPLCLKNPGGSIWLRKTED